MAKKKEWWQSIFPATRQLFDTIKPSVSNDETRYIINKLGLKPGMKFLDCPCGIGRISIPMTRKGIKVTGVDITIPYLQELSKKAQRKKLKIDLHEMDMRKINFKNQFDGAGNLGTSFGYFDKESDNMLVIKKAYQAIKPGGKYLVHVINRDWIITYFESHGWTQLRDFKIVEDRNFDYRNSTMHSRWYMLRDGKEVSYDIRLRMYSFHELAEMFKKAGFENIEGYGSVNDDPISQHSRMMFVFGTRPKRRK